jgi:hypothetical protein
VNVPISSITAAVRASIGPFLRHVMASPPVKRQRSTADQPGKQPMAARFTKFMTLSRLPPTRGRHRACPRT